MLSPPYSARQQYFPIAVVFVVAELVAEPATNVTALPIWLPAVPSQPPTVTAAG